MNRKGQHREFLSYSKRRVTYWKNMRLSEHDKEDSPAKRPRKKGEGFRVEGGHRLSIGSGATLASLCSPNISTCLIAYWAHLIPI